MIQDGICVNLGDPLNFLMARDAGTSQKRQGLADDLVEVGLIGSTQRSGKPITRGSDQWKCSSLKD
jgi:hypothetical protein